MYLTSAFYIPDVAHTVGCNGYSSLSP